jgi:hypothetical protein
VRTLSHVLFFCPIRARYRHWRWHQPFWRDDKTAQMLGVSQYGCWRCGYGAIRERDSDPEKGGKGGTFPPLEARP